MNPAQNNNPTPAERIAWWQRLIGTGFFTGYVPTAPGTAGSLLAASVMFIPGFGSWEILIPSTVFLFLLGGKAADAMEKVHGQDPSIVTVDEIVGMWLTLWFVPFSYLNLALAFVLFRVLDILKPYPAVLIDKKSGGWNIMLDDIIAALYANGILQIALRINILSL